MDTDTETRPPQQAIVILEPPDRAELDLERAALIAEVERILPAAIATPAEYRAVADLETRLGVFLAKTEPLFDTLCASAHKTWKTATTIRGLFLDGPKALKGRARTLLGGYVEREARERRAREQAIAEEEQARAVARNREEARRLEQQGQPELAAAVRTQPVDTPAVQLPTAVPKVTGLSYREQWYWEPVGGDTPANRTRALSMLVKSEWLMFVQFNDAGLTAFAERTKGTIRVPGIVFRSRQVPVRR